jgi:hypothetical protein
MRWSLRLSEFDFVIKHRPGSKIGHVDALSRHVSTVVDQEILSKESVLGNKRKTHSVTVTSQELIPVRANFSEMMVYCIGGRPTSNTSL